MSRDRSLYLLAPCAHSVAPLHQLADQRPQARGLGTASSIATTNALTPFTTAYRAVEILVVIALPLSLKSPSYDFVHGMVVEE